MSWPRIFSRHSHEPGKSGSSRVFIYLALAVIALLLTYQLVLNHDALGATTHWKPGFLSGTPTDDKEHAGDGWAGSAMKGTLQDAVDQAASATTDSISWPTSAAGVPVPVPVAPSQVIKSSSSTPSPSEIAVPEEPRPISKELVIAAMSYSDMSWVDQNVPDWTANIYRTDMPKGKAQFTVPKNKGNEAMVYLT